MRFIGRLRRAQPRAAGADRRTPRRSRPGNDRLRLFVAMNYGGRGEIVDAARRFAAECGPEAGEAEFAPFLYAPHLRDPELVIRTSGEQRISNFLLWQCAYAELHLLPAALAGLRPRGPRARDRRVRAPAPPLRRTVRTRWRAHEPAPHRGPRHRPRHAVVVDRRAALRDRGGPDRRAGAVRALQPHRGRAAAAMGGIPRRVAIIALAWGMDDPERGMLLGLAPRLGLVAVAGLIVSAPRRDHHRMATTLLGVVYLASRWRSWWSCATCPTARRPWPTCWWASGCSTRPRTSAAACGGRLPIAPRTSQKKTVEGARHRPGLGDARGVGRRALHGLDRRLGVADPGPRDLPGGLPRRPLRVGAEARRRREGLGAAADGARRGARPLRRPAVRARSPPTS